MSWLKLDDGFASHPKINALTDREFRVWMRVLCWCARYKTGEIKGAIHEIPGLKQALPKLFSTGLIEGENGMVEVHDWAHYQPKDPTGAERQARFRNGESNGFSNGSLARAPVPVPSLSQEDEGLPPFVSSYVGVEDGKGSTHDRLYALAVRDEDKQKIERASKGLPESVLIEALDAAAGESVRDPLAAALARLKTLRVGKPALPPIVPVVVTEAAPTVSAVALAEAFIRTVGAGYERSTMDEELGARGIVGAEHARLLAMHAGLESP